MSEKSFAARLPNVTQPILAELKTIDAEIEAVQVKVAALQAQIAELKREKRQGERMLNLIDPQAVPQPVRRRSRSEGGKSSTKVAPETREKIEEWLRENVSPGEPFYGNGLLRDGFQLTSGPTLAVALNELQAQGRIRLDSIGNGGRKNFVLVDA
jgi:hypothetical protein